MDREEPHKKVVRLTRDLKKLRSHLKLIQALALRQITDKELWIEDGTFLESNLQKALRDLHSVIEGIED